MYMNNQTSVFLTFIALVGLLTGCTKQQLVDNSYPNVVNLLFTVNSSVELEFVYRGSVLVSTNADGNLTLSKALDVEGQSEELQARELESKKVVATYEVTASPAEQSLTLYYDGTQAYDALINYTIRGYAMSGTLEFVVDGEVLEEGTTAINKSLSIYLNEGDSKELQVRVKGETAPLITEILDTAADGKSLQFFFDGTAMIDQIPELTPPTDPANMAIHAQFNPDFQDFAIFSGDAEVDLVFYIRNAAGEVSNPGIMVTAPTDGTFVTFELPPLPGENTVYTFDIRKKGSDAMVYSDFSLVSLFPPEQSKGRYGEVNFGMEYDPKYFEAGTSKLLLLGPAQSLKTTNPRARFVFGKVVQDLSQYFPAPGEEEEEPENPGEDDESGGTEEETGQGE